ncbi:hypothetical protein B0T26DRAFT_713646, partial [Lasiosphaeria miniovina]
MYVGAPKHPAPCCLPLRYPGAPRKRIDPNQTQPNPRVNGTKYENARRRKSAAPVDETRSPKKTHKTQPSRKMDRWMDG